MKALLIVAGLALFAVPASAQQGAWCDKNCVTLCNKIYGARNAGPCIAKHQCAQFAGRPCASAAYVNARHVIFCGNSPQECAGGGRR